MQQKHLGVMQIYTFENVHDILTKMCTSPDDIYIYINQFRVAFRFVWLSLNSAVPKLKLLCRSPRAAVPERNFHCGGPQAPFPVAVPPCGAVPSAPRRALSVTFAIHFFRSLPSVNPSSTKCSAYLIQYHRSYRRVRTPHDLNDPEKHNVHVPLDMICTAQILHSVSHHHNDGYRIWIIFDIFRDLSIRCVRTNPRPQRISPYILCRLEAPHPQPTGSLIWTQKKPKCHGNSHVPPRPRKIPRASTCRSSVFTMDVDNSVHCVANPIPPTTMHLRPRTVVCRTDYNGR